jgi:collagenase-like PrtC family protease
VCSSDLQLSDKDIETLNEAGIGLRLPLTNHFCDPKDYERSLWLLDKYHDEMNSVIVTNDILALQIRRDFPKYAIEASVIKNLRSLKSIEKALETYDSVVTPMDMNDDKDFLESLPKDKIRLFANAACAYTCPSKICYASFSKINRGDDIKAECSMDTKPRDFKGMHDFNVSEFEDMGFTKFKLLRHG